MNSRRTLREWARLLYRLSENTISLIGVVLTTSSGITLIAFWIYDFILPGPPHPYIGILLFLVLPAVFILGLVLIPIGILLHEGSSMPPESCPKSSHRRVATSLSYAAPSFLSPRPHF